MKKLFLIACVTLLVSGQLFAMEKDDFVTKLKKWNNRWNTKNVFEPPVHYFGEIVDEGLRTLNHTKKTVWSATNLVFTPALTTYAYAKDIPVAYKNEDHSAIKASLIFAFVALGLLPFQKDICSQIWNHLFNPLFNKIFDHSYEFCTELTHKQIARYAAGKMGKEIFVS